MADRKIIYVVCATNNGDHYPSEERIFSNWTAANSARDYLISKNMKKVIIREAFIEDVFPTEGEMKKQFCQHSGVELNKKAKKKEEVFAPDINDLWVSIEESEPSSYQEVIFCSTEEPIVVPTQGLYLGKKFDDKRFIVYDGQAYNATHWMPMPEMPE